MLAPQVRAALSRARSAWRGTDPTAPSFFFKRAELRRIREIGHELGVRDPVFDVNSKTDSRAWADRLGIRRAAVLAEVADADAVPWETLPRQLVVKPVRGAGSRGVHLLRREAGAYRHLQTGAVLTVDDITAALRDLADRGTISRELVVEELVEDPRRPGQGPVDWKLSTFFGRIGVVEAKVTDPGREPVWKVFDEQWRDLGRGHRHHHPLDPSIQPPVHRDEVLDLARRISACVPRPFVRIDLYDSADGPVFGEITPEPGGPPGGFRPDLDRSMGRLWEEAEARLMARSAAAGIIAPADAPLAESALVLTREPGRRWQGQRPAPVPSTTEPPSPTVP